MSNVIPRRIAAPRNPSRTVRVGFRVKFRKLPQVRFVVLAATYAANALAKERFASVKSDCAQAASGVFACGLGLVWAGHGTDTVTFPDSL